MPSKRPREDDPKGTTPHGDGGDGDARQKKARHGFRVGPENLPDGPWRRKVDKIKKNLIVKAKVKKQYAKVKAELKQHQPTPALPLPADELDAPTAAPAEAEAAPEPIPETMHPARQAMIEDPSIPDTLNPPTQTGEDRPPPRRQKQKQQHRHNRPDYYEKELALAEQKKADAEAREAEIARRNAERAAAIADRERYRRAMAKAKEPGRDGKRKVGKESRVLLDRVMRIVGNGA